MPNLKDIKSRINNAGVAEKVTFSMKNIAAAKLAQARKFYYSGKDYLTYNDKILQYLLLTFQKNGYHCDNSNIVDVVFCGKQNLPKLIFVVGADRGLCGSFNANVIKTTEKFLSKLKENNTDFFILTLGSKVKNYFSAKYKEKVHSFPYKLDIGNFGREEALLIVNYIFKLIIEQKVGTVDFIYTNFVSVLENFPKISQVFPVDFSVIANKKDDKSIKVEDLNVVTDKFIGSIVDNIIKDVLLSSTYKAIIESLTSEYSSRVNAMDNAFNNSKELLDDLSLEYNRTRQNLITKELIEIISGNEAL